MTVVIRVYATTPLAGEPRFEGRTFTEWESDLTAHSPYVRTKAVEGLSNFGPRAVPALVKTFHTDRDETVRMVSLGALVGILPLGGDAVRTLLSAVTDSNSTISVGARMIVFELHGPSGFSGRMRCRPS